LYTNPEVKKSSEITTLVHYQLITTLLIYTKKQKRGETLQLSASRRVVFSKSAQKPKKIILSVTNEPKITAAFGEKNHQH
jgi:hypothetical protein